MSRGTLEDLQHRLVDETGQEPPVPPHWPTEGFVLKVDCGRRASWLPQEFGQGIKETANGKTLQAYIHPDGKLHYHKKDMEKALGIDLSNTDLPPMDGLGRLIEWESFSATSDEDKLMAKLEAPSHWPSDVVVDLGKRMSWLPPDWGTGFRRSSNGNPLRVFISPEGTLRFHKDKIIKEWFNNQPLPELNLSTNGRGDPLDMPKSKANGVWRLLENPVGTPVAKRQRKEEPPPKTKQLTEGQSPKDAAVKDVRQGFSLSGAEGSWIVVPDDVISVDLDRLAEKIEGAGWVAVAGPGAGSRLFSSSLAGRETALALNVAGKMEVDGGVENDIRGLARLYVDEWLWEDD